MKSSIKNILLFASMMLILIIVSCGSKKDDPAPDKIEAVVEGLSKPWTASTVTFANGNVNTDWSGFVLTFNNTRGYSATVLSDESVLVWPASGTYTFPDLNNPNLILRDDGVLITIESLTSTKTKLVFTITGRNEGRTDGLLGEWEFELGS